MRLNFPVKSTVCFMSALLFSYIAHTNLVSYWISGRVLHEVYGILDEVSVTAILIDNDHTSVALKCFRAVNWHIFSVHCFIHMPELSLTFLQNQVYALCMRHPFRTSRVQMWYRIELVCVSDQVEYCMTFFNNCCLIWYRPYTCRTKMFQSS